VTSFQRIVLGGKWHPRRAGNPSLGNRNSAGIAAPGVLLAAAMPMSLREREESGLSPLRPTRPSACYTQIKI
jgi:hypothetical protein